MSIMAKGLCSCALILSVLTATGCTPINDIQETEGLKFPGVKYEEEIAALRKEIESLRERVANLEITHGNSDVTEKGIRSGLNSYNLKSDPAQHILKKRALRRRRRRVPEVAFQAALSHESATFKLYDAIIFNDVITNIGGAYDKNTGIFKAPFSGTYSFYTSIVSEKGHYVEASIQVNDRATVSAISDHRILSNEETFDIWDQGNAVAILRLRKGDKVSVTIQWPQGRHDIHGVGKSSFSGYLVRSHEHLVL